MPVGVEDARVVVYATCYPKKGEEPGILQFENGDCLGYVRGTGHLAIEATQRGIRAPKIIPITDERNDPFAEVAVTGLPDLVVDSAEMSQYDLSKPADKARYESKNCPALPTSP